MGIFFQDNNFFIDVSTHYADGKTESFSRKDIEKGWIPMGMYQLSEGEIYRADAVKWVKVEDEHK
ncbi:hypothetical protein [uncultured Sanguibacteroides sp.]|uniref:hypothetical protein n=1 Tax=uncultured Sanguibacteroides sp. TaxID=1635151 RepID=UPI0025DD154F|nr:hypothetical protein [uncultured Sanguibacteroides sp.]